MITEPSALCDITCFVIAVPTSIVRHHRPDLGPVLRASATVGAALRQSSGYASTAYKMGQSPERINPGDREHSFEKIVNVMSGEDQKAAVDTKQSRPDVQYWSV